MAKITLGELKNLIKDVVKEEVEASNVVGNPEWKRGPGGGNKSPWYSAHATWEELGMQPPEKGAPPKTIKVTVPEEVAEYVPSPAEMKLDSVLHTGDAFYVLSVNRIGITASHMYPKKWAKQQRSRAMDPNAVEDILFYMTVS